VRAVPRALEQYEITAGPLGEGDPHGGPAGARQPAGRPPQLTAAADRTTMMTTNTYQDGTP
jgi:hypothetical protein